jgi:hypothetical protein
MRLRVFTLMSLLCLSLTLAFAGQIQAASNGCNELNNRPASAVVIPATTGLNSGTIPLGTLYYDAGEVITVSAASGLSGGVALQDGSGGTLASALLPNSAVYTVPASGVYTFAMYFDVSNHTASDLPGEPTVSCSGTPNSDGRTFDFPNAAVYNTEDGMLISATTNLGEGAFLSISAAELAEFDPTPDENFLVASSGDGFVSFYILTTGEYQINIGPDASGKVYVVIFTGLPPTDVYRHDFNVNDILFPATPVATAVP